MRMVCTKKHLLNLTELFDNKKERISAKTFAKFYKLLLEKNADKCLEQIPIGVMAKEKEDAGDPDAAMLKELLNMPESKSSKTKKYTDIKQYCVIKKGTLESFSNATGLTELMLPENIKKVEAFHKCDVDIKGIKKIIIPKSVEEISGLEKLVDLEEIEVDIENSIYTSEKGLLLKHCGKLFELVMTAPTVKKLVIPKKCKNCHVLFNKYEEVLVENGNQYYKMTDGYLTHKGKEEIRLVYVVPGLKNAVIPDGTTHINEGLFSKEIISIEMPDSVTEIETFAFCECEQLKSVKLSRGLKFLGYYYESQSSYSSIFENCIALEEIEIPEGV